METNYLFFKSCLVRPVQLASPFIENSYTQLSFINSRISTSQGSVKSNRVDVNCQSIFNNEIIPSCILSSINSLSSSTDLSKKEYIELKVLSISRFLDSFIMLQENFGISSVNILFCFQFLVYIMDTILTRLLSFLFFKI